MIDVVRSALQYLDGYSTFYVDNDNKIYHHTLDQVRGSRDKEVTKTLIQRLVEIINRQRVSQPAFFK